MSSSESSATVRYSFPDPQLFDCVAAIAEAHALGSDLVQDIAPPEMTVISICLSGRWRQGDDRNCPRDLAAAMVHGPTSRARWFGGSEGASLGMALHPLVWPLWFGKKAEHFADKSVPLSTLLGDRADDLLSRLAGASSFEDRLAVVNSFFLALPKQGIDADLSQRIMALRMALSDPDCTTVQELSARVGLTKTRLARMATACFGFPPKTLIRIARFRRMLHRADVFSYGAWREYIEGQYVDQSHLIRDFQAFLGMSPSRYFELERPFVSAAFSEARRLLGPFASANAQSD